MNKSAKGKDGRKAAGPGQLWLRLPGLVREALYDTVIGAGLACVDEVLEAERVMLCGERYAHLAERQALRAGHVASSLVLGGRRVAVQRPRARSVAGRELKLPSWQEWSARDPLEARALEQMVLGVSTRRYARSLEPLPAAMGVDERGDKHVLGLREGATENASAVRALLADLVERGLDTNRSLLIVIDGAKALHKAVIEVFGARGLIQRCREHKKRNVTDALPERLRAAVRSAMNQAYATRNAGRARRLLDNLARRLEHQHPGAAASLREGLDETLTVMGLGLPENLERVLSSTNLIENLFSRVRVIGRRVTHWQSGTMVLRWAAAGVLEAERGFRKLAGYRAMPSLVAALRTRDTQFTRIRQGVDASERAA